MFRPPGLEDQLERQIAIGVGQREDYVSPPGLEHQLERPTATGEEQTEFYVSPPGLDHLLERPTATAVERTEDFGIHVSPPGTADVGLDGRTTISSPSLTRSPFLVSENDLDHANTKLVLPVQRRRGLSLFLSL